MRAAPRNCRSICTAARPARNHRRTVALRHELGRLTAPASAPHWEQAVFARIAEGEGQGRRAGRWWLSLPVLGGALLLALLVWPRGSSPDRSPPELAGPMLTLRFQASEAPEDRLRGAGPGEAKVGALMEIRAAALVGKQRELRVYQDDRGLLMRCSDAPPCQIQDQALLARWKIPAIGRYRIVVLGGLASAPPSTGKYESDLAALKAQEQIQVLEETVEVW